MDDITDIAKESNDQPSPYVAIISLIVVLSFSGFYWMYSELHNTQMMLIEVENKLEQKELESSKMLAKIKEAEADKAQLNELLKNMGDNPALPDKDIAAQNEEDLITTREEEVGTVAFSLVSPKAGDRLCLGENYFVEWVAPKEMRSVELIVRRAGDAPINTLTIGFYPATYNEDNESGVGRVPWTVGEVVSQYGQTSVTNPITPGAAYEMILSGIYEGGYVVDVSDIFSIANCQG